MKVFRGLPRPDNQTPCALVIGNFDGVHRGHQALLARARMVAAERGLPLCVMTFEPHPREYFAKFNPAIPVPNRIANLRDKLDALRRQGVDFVVVEHFHAAFASLSPEAFIENILVKGLHVQWLLVGDDFRFGAKRAGDFTLLEQAAQQYGFAVERMHTVHHDNVRISSSEVRTALADGNLQLAKELLGHPYTISGHVLHGRKLGRTLDFPTLNLRVKPDRPALKGIFVVRVHGLTAQPLRAVASLGVRPTVEEAGRVLLEVHVFDFDQTVYGKLVKIEFLKKLRDEEKYDDLATLRAAIANDASQALQYFEANPS